MLFEHLPDVHYFVKNRRGQFMLVNRNFLDQCGVRDMRQVLDKTDFDFFPLDLAQEYVSDDRKVLEQGLTIVNKVELVRNKEGAINWFITTKIPLHDRQGRIHGLAGITRDMDRSSTSWQPLNRMAPVVDYIRNNLEGTLLIPDLASRACLSVSQFERRFKSLFNITPLKYIIKMRVMAACRELAESDESISRIAFKLGFYDHSAFTRHFSGLIGMPPKEFRRRNLNFTSAER